MEESDFANNYSFDFVGNASSLVPMTKATLSGRDSVVHLISSAGHDIHQAIDSYSNQEVSPTRDNNDLNMMNRQDVI